MIINLNRPNYNAWTISSDSYPGSESIESKIQYFLKYALLAVSAINAQPWLFSINGDELLVKYNETKMLPVMDAHSRSLYIGIGAAIGNLEIAAHYFGYSLSIEYLFHGVDVVKIKVFPTRNVDDSLVEMFSAITQMKTNRRKRLDLAISLHSVKKIETVLLKSKTFYRLVQNQEEKEQIGDLVVSSIRYVFSNTRCRRDLAKWVRDNYTHKYDGMPAYTKGIPDIPSLIVPLILKYVNIGKQHATSSKRMIISSPVTFVLGSSIDSLRNWVSVGQSMQKISLMSISEKLSVGIFIGPIEFEELREKVVSCLNLSFAPQIFLSIGYCSRGVEHSPRHQLQQILLS